MSSEEPAVSRMASIMTVNTMPVNPAQRNWILKTWRCGLVLVDRDAQQPIANQKSCICCIIYS